MTNEELAEDGVENFVEDDISFDEDDDGYVGSNKLHCKIVPAQIFRLHTMHDQ